MDESSTPLRALLVEDDLRIVRRWLAILRRAGIDAESVGSVREARDFLEKATTPLDVVLVDIQLPDGDGTLLLDMAGRIAGRPALVVVSGHLDSETVVRLHDRCAAMVPKPLKAKTLVALVQTLSRDRLVHTIEAFASHHRLSPRETEALTLACTHHDSPEVLDRMDCSFSTLRTYWARIFEKTGHRSQRDVVSAVLMFAVDKTR